MTRTARREYMSSLATLHLRHLAQIAACLLATASAQGAVVDAFGFSSPGLVTRVSTYSIGYEFNVLSPVDVVSLGLFDAHQDGLTQSHPVGIFDSLGNLMVSTTVSPSDPLSGYFRYHTIAPVRLDVANGYRIAAVNGAESYGLRVHDFISDAALQFVQNRYSAANTSVLIFPNTHTTPADDVGYFGPNFQLTPVPEPATFAFVVTGLAIVLGAVRRAGPKT